MRGIVAASTTTHESESVKAFALLVTMAQAVEAGTLTVPIHQTFALADAAEALAAFSAGTRGKIVLLT